MARRRGCTLERARRQRLLGDELRRRRECTRFQHGIGVLGRLSREGRVDPAVSARQLRVCADGAAADA